MKATKIMTILSMVTVCLFLFSCAPKDTDIQKSISEKMATMPAMSGLTTTVKEGIVTISGECKDNTCKTSCETMVKGIKGVKSVVNNCTIPPPPAPVVINPDATLITAVQGVLNNYPGVTANVSLGVVTLTGEIKKNNLMPLMQSIQTLKPKKVENKLIIK
ncbi:BON domain-containing protein [Flavobacterium praedii]|uniref:BON domain-containing protein n=1 Tax=Flavobacterium praedii TaxID=3002900 RepID=UPI002481B71A|nr:BON domain-containing protein [Flavobacterium praedii]